MRTANQSPQADQPFIVRFAGSDVLLAVTLPLGLEIYDLSKSTTEAIATVVIADEGLIAASAFARTVVEAVIDPSQVLASHATLHVNTVVWYLQCMADNAGSAGAGAYRLLLQKR